MIENFQNRFLHNFFFLYIGKSFLNTIEYLDLTTNEWTTFIPNRCNENGSAENGTTENCTIENGTTENGTTDS